MTEKVNVDPNLEYNLAGGLLLTLREQDIKGLAENLKASGYQYGCVLPFRALTSPKAVDTLKNNLDIVHFEEAWNPTNHDFFPLAILSGLLGNARRKMGDKSEPPILQDAFFPSKYTCEELFESFFTLFPSAKFISHAIDLSYPGDKLLVEINPGIKMEASQILEETERNGIGLVFDPRHLLPSDQTISLPNQPTQQAGGEWEKQFNQFSSQIEVVDINPPSLGDVDLLLKGKGILAELASAAYELNTVRFFRVEVPIPITDQLPGISVNSTGFKFLKEIGDSLKAAK